MTERHATYNAELESLLDDMTPKQAMFCREYFIDLNATAAAKRAGYSERSAYSIGAENMSKPVIIAAIDLFFERKCEEIAISADVIEREYWTLYREARDKGLHAVARACLKDLGEYHAMFVKQVAFLDGGQLAERLTGGRARMNSDHALSPDGRPARDRMN